MARKSGSALPGGGTAPAAHPLEFLAKRIRALRAQRQLTQEEFAERAGISVSFVSMLERGERSPSYETALLMAEALEVPPCELLREEGAAYDDPYYRVLGDFARRHRMSMRQVDRLLEVARALFELPEDDEPRERPPLPDRPEPRRCGAGGCERPVLARELCAAHYHAERRRQRRR